MDRAGRGRQLSAERKLDPGAVLYSAQRNNDKLDIQLYIPGYVEGDKTMAMMAFIALDHTVGEYDTETKIGAIDLLPRERAPKDAQTLDSLPRTLDATSSPHQLATSMSFGRSARRRKR
jgi:hypothetical protein